MRKHIASIACTAALLLGAVALPARAQDDTYGTAPEWTDKVRFLISAGVNSSEVINFLTFRGGSGHTGWGWQAAAAYPLKSEPFFVEAGLMGWRLGRENMDDVKRFGLHASGGIRFAGGATEAGAGIIPGGGRVFIRHFFQRETPGRGTMAQLGIAFPSARGTRSFLDASLGYAF